MNKKPLRVVELFAGVGGFRIALEGYPKRKNSDFEVVWSNQFEPRTKKQHANLVYQHRWPDANHSQEDIENIVENNINNIPNHDVLVGGFPCQDYSIANRSHNKGIKGTKGKLWWAINAILKAKRPQYILLENVDRLLCSPFGNRGQDFATMLSCLNRLGYAVEWRVINAAEYGYPQRRRRVFILGYHKSSKVFKSLATVNPKDWLNKKGVSAKAFPVQSRNEIIEVGCIPNAETDISTTTAFVFKKAGMMIDGKFFTLNVKPNFNGTYKSLGDILLDKKLVSEEFTIPNSELPRWHNAKNAKAIERISKRTGKPYIYREGNVKFPDLLDKPSRTILTSEGGTYPERSKHAVLQNKTIRRLHPIELERLSGFPDDFTKHPAITNPQRAHFMGNALVVDIVRRFGYALAKAAST